MAYCNNCGAYIPDGQSQCLACGFDENREAEKTAAASAAQSAPHAAGGFDSEFLRRQLEEKRRRDRENSKKWAEAEFARRQRQQEQREKAAQSHVNREQSTRTNAATPDYAAGLGKAMPSSKTLAALSYLGPLCLLPFFLAKDDDYSQFHARQGLGLFVAGIGANLVSTILGLNWLVTLLWVFMIYKGMTAASAGKREPLPYIGGLFLKK